MGDTILRKVSSLPWMGLGGLIAAGWVSWLPLFAEGAKPHPPILYGEHVLPIIEEHCASCHRDRRSRGGLSLQTREALLQGGDSGPVVVPGSSEKSRLIAILAGDDPELVMPPKGERLTDEEVAVLRLWIDQGLKWDGESGSTPAAGDAEALTIEPRRPELPAPVGGLDHPVDRLLHAYWGEQGVEPGTLVDDPTFLRRASLDLVGLLPSPEALDGFLQDRRPDKREKLVSKLLSDRKAYTEHWLSFWSDLLRNDYSGVGYIDGGRKAITDWLYRSLHENKPYDEFVRELISPVPGSEGFSYGIKWRGRVNASQVRELQFSQNVSQVFLGINMKCASCHDSFVSDWKLKDAYGLAAIYAEKPLELHRCDVPTGETARPKFLYPQLGDVDPEAPREERLRRLAELLTHDRNGRFARTIVNRLWARLMGRGIVEPVDAMERTPWSRDLLDYLAVHLVESGYDLKETLELIATSRAYQLRCAEAVSEEEKEYIFRGPQLKRMTAEQFVDAVWMITGTGPEKSAAKTSAVEEAARLADAEGSSVTEVSFARASLQNADALLRALGRPNREQVVSTRPGVFTTLEALELMNGEVFAGLIERGAQHIRRRHPAAGRQLVEDLYTRALSRRPSAEELSTALELLGERASEESVADLLWILFVLPEFQLIH